MGPFPRQLVWNKQDRFMSVWLKCSCGDEGGGWSEMWMFLVRRKDDKWKLIA